MATQTELEEMIVRLTADVGHYMEEMNHVAKHTQQVADKIQHEGTRIEQFGEKLEGFASKAERAFAVVGIGVGLHEAFEKFEQSEKLWRRLDAAIEVNGGNVRQVTQEYKKFATELANTTAYSKTEILTTLQRAEALGKTGEQAKKVTKDALALAAATGVDTQSAAMAISMYEEGNKHYLQRMLHLHGITDAEELQEKIQQRLTMGYKIMEAEGETAGAKLQRTWNKLGEVTKLVGAAVGSFIEPIVDKIHDAADWFSKLSDNTKGWIVNIGLAVGATALLASQWTRIVAIYESLAALQTVWAASRIFTFSDAIATVISKIGALTTAFLSLKVVQAGLWTALLLGIAEGVIALSGINSELEKLDNWVKNNQKNYEKMGEWQKKVTNDKLKDAETTIDSLEKQKKLEEEVRRTEKERREAEEFKKDMERNKEENRLGVLGGTANFINRQFGGTDARKAVEEPLRAANEQMKIAEENANRAKEALEKFLHPKATPEAVEHIKKTMKALDEAHKLADIYNEIDKKVQEQRLKHIDDETLKKYRAALEEEQMDNIRKKIHDNELERQKKQVETANEVFKKLQEEADTLGMLTEKQKELYRVNEQLKDSSPELRAIAERQVKANWDLKESTQEYLRMLEEIAKLNEDALTPLEKYLDRVDQLNTMYGTGLLSQQAYIKAMADAEKQLDDAGNAAIKTRNAVQSLNAVLYGSQGQLEQKYAAMDAIRLGVQNNQAKREAQGFTPPEELQQRQKERAEAVRKQDEAIKAILMIGTNIVNAIEASGEEEQKNVGASNPFGGGYLDYGAGFNNIYP